MGYEDTKVLATNEDGTTIRLPSSAEEHKTIDRMENTDIVNMMSTGKILDAYVYKFKDHQGNEVVDLSKDGLFAFANLRKGIQLKRIYDNIDDKEADDFYIIYEATDLQTGDTREGGAQQSRSLSNGQPDQYGLAKVISKAQRNSLKNILNVDSYRELILIFLEKHAEQEKKLIALSIRDNMRKFNFSEEEVRQYVDSNFSNTIENLDTTEMKKLNSFIASKKGKEYFSSFRSLNKLKSKIESGPYDEKDLNDFVIDRKKVPIHELDSESLENLINFLDTDEGKGFIKSE